MIYAYDRYTSNLLQGVWNFVLQEQKKVFFYTCLYTRIVTNLLWSYVLQVYIVFNFFVFTFSLSFIFPHLVFGRIRKRERKGKKCLRILLIRQTSNLANSSLCRKDRSYLISFQDVVELPGSWFEWKGFGWNRDVLAPKCQCWKQVYAHATQWYLTDSRTALAGLER